MPRTSINETVYQRLLSLKEHRGGSISDSIAWLLQRVVGIEFDLLGTKDTGLIGAIGETIAWQYLWGRGIIAFELGHNRPSFKPNGIPVHLNQGLTEQQLRFLGEAREHLSWDFVGYQRNRAGEEQNRACLIEVKTSRPGKPKDGLRIKGRRGMTTVNRREASRLGFTLLLVNVQLTDEWQARVTDREIPVN